MNECASAVIGTPASGPNIWAADIGWDGCTFSTGTLALFYVPKSSAGPTGSATASVELYGSNGGGAAVALLALTPDVPPAMTVAVTPAIVALNVGETAQFTATVTGTTYGDVSWSVSEAAGGGSITPGGLYTAPGVPGTFHVVASSLADPSKTATATVTVNGSVQEIVQVGTVEADDILVALAPTGSAPGWNAVANIGIANVFWRRALGPEDIYAGLPYMSAVAIFRGAARTGNPFEAVSTGAGITAPSITTSTPNTLLLFANAAWAEDMNECASAVIGTPASGPNIWAADIGWDGCTFSTGTLALFYVPKSSAGPTGSATASVELYGSNGGGAAVALLALTPHAL
jgi:hypothetical protein